MSKNATLQDKNGEQLFPATTADQVTYGDGTVKSRLDELQKLRNTSIYYASGTSGTTKTYNLEASCVYLVTVGRINTSSTTGGGMYIVTTHATTGNVVAVKTSDIMTVSINKTVLSLTFSANYLLLSIMKIAAYE